MIKNILFDFGGVFVRVDRDEAVRRFEALGVEDAGDLLSPYRQTGLFLDYESGKYDEAVFTQQLNNRYNLSLTTDQVRHALHGFLGEVHQYKFDYIESELPEDLRLLVISNINPSIWEPCRQGEVLPNGRDIESYFERCYTSYEVGVCKPEREIFDHIIKDAGIRPEETLLIDDGPANTAAGRELGFVTYRAENGEDWRPLLDKMLK